MVSPAIVRKVNRDKVKKVLSNATRPETRIKSDLELGDISGTWVGGGCRSPSIEHLGNTKFNINEQACPYRPHQLLEKTKSGLLDSSTSTRSWNEHGVNILTSTVSDTSVIGSSKKNVEGPKVIN